MSDSSIPEASPELDQWLLDRRRELETSVAKVINVAAGLRDAKLPALHANLTDALDEMLDIDAGVDAIAPFNPLTPRFSTNTSEPLAGLGAGGLFGAAAAGIAGLFAAGAVHPYDGEPSDEDLEPDG